MKNTLKLEDLIENVKTYITDEKDINEIVKAYKFAERLHEGQYRQSGEPYIIHPLNVAYILSDLKLDKDTIIAGLLHDVIEDSDDVSEEDIKNEFNEEVAMLVDGVTKIRAIEFLKQNNNDKKAAKIEQNLANTRKLITGMLITVRIILIKLADRLHNMRTLQYKRREKQIENALETRKIFVPLSNFLGIREIRNELEELSFKYIECEEYKKIYELRLQLEEKNKTIINEMALEINETLNQMNITNNINTRLKNAYRIYKRLEGGGKLENIKDLYAFKVLVNDINECYISLGKVHNLYHPLNNTFKDYICNPKTNMYRSLHTTVIGKDGKLTEIQIRTFEMDKINKYGLTVYSNKKDENGNDLMQQKLNEQFQFFDSLKEINDYSLSNAEFVEQLNSELFSEQIYVYTTEGKVISLPVGASIIDFAYKLDPNMGNNLSSAYINGELVPLYSRLRNKDRVKIVADTKSSGPNMDWLNSVQTARAKSNILTYNYNIKNIK